MGGSARPFQIWEFGMRTTLIVQIWIPGLNARPSPTIIETGTENKKGTDLNNSKIDTN